MDEDPWTRKLRDASGEGRWAGAAADGAGAGSTRAGAFGSLAILGHILSRFDRPAAVKLLVQAQVRFPDDLWINHELAYNLVEFKPPRFQEAIGYYRAALAIRPGSLAIQCNLGIALELSRATRRRARPVPWGNPTRAGSRQTPHRPQLGLSEKRGDSTRRSPKLTRRSAFHRTILMRARHPQRLFLRTEGEAG